MCATKTAYMTATINIIIQGTQKKKQKAVNQGSTDHFSNTLADRKFSPGSYLCTGPVGREF